MKLFPEAGDATNRASNWILEAQNPDGGWGGDLGIASSIEETGLALSALAGLPGTAPARERGTSWLATATQRGNHTPASPIGFYFARLWYYEVLYPLIFAVESCKPQ